MTRILVTGGTGFIGRATIRQLMLDGVQVTMAVRRDGQYDEGTQPIVVGDIHEGTMWRNAVDGCDAVVHLAAIVHQRRMSGTDSRAQYMRVNRDGTLCLARAAANAGVRRFVFVSSIKVNGETTDGRLPFREDDTPSPADQYGESKAEAEAGLFALARSSAMEVVVIRPPLVYGPGVSANFHSMMRWIASGVPLPLGAVSGNRRSLLAVDNLVSLVSACLEHPNAANELFVASDGEDLSTRQLVVRIARALHVQPRLISVPTSVLQASAVLIGQRFLADRLLSSLQVDSSKARALLGWQPVVSVDEGLQRTVASGIY